MRDVGTLLGLIVRSRLRRLTWSFRDSARLVAEIEADHATLKRLCAFALPGRP